MSDDDEHNVDSMDEYIDLEASKGFDRNNNNDDDEDEYFDEGLFPIVIRFDVENLTLN